MTKAEVDALEIQARNLFTASDCQAIPVLAEYGRKSTTRNMIAASLDPYYGVASYDDRKDYPYSKLFKLVPLETMANEYKGKET